MSGSKQTIGARIMRCSFIIARIECLHSLGASRSVLFELISYTDGI